MLKCDVVDAISYWTEWASKPNVQRYDIALFKIWTQLEKFIADLFISYALGDYSEAGYVPERRLRFDDEAQFNAFMAGGKHVNYIEKVENFSKYIFKDNPFDIILTDVKYSGAFYDVKCLRDYIAHESGKARENFLGRFFNKNEDKFVEPNDFLKGLEKKTGLTRYNYYVNCISVMIDRIIDPSDTPSVFISYSRENEEHNKWVLKLATDLCKNGVDVNFDRWNSVAGNDLSDFIGDGLPQKNKLLCICTESYVDILEKKENEILMNAIMSTNKSYDGKTQKNIISIIKNIPSNRCIPSYFVSEQYIDFSEDDQYFVNFGLLINQIYGLYDENNKRVPVFVASKLSSDDLMKEITVKTNFESVLYHSSKFDDDITFHYGDNDGIFSIGSGKYIFDIKWIRSGNDSIRVSAMKHYIIGFNLGVMDFPSLDEIANFNYSSQTRIIHAGEIVVFVNEHNHYAAIKLCEIKNRVRGLSDDVVSFKYHIYDA